MGFTNFKIEGRGLGSALILEFLLYYMTKPEYQLHVREELYLDNMLGFVLKSRERFLWTNTRNFEDIFAFVFLRL